MWLKQYNNLPRKHKALKFRLPKQKKPQKAKTKNYWTVRYGGPTYNPSNQEAEEGR
jgi:hypothetical protein